MKKIIAAIDALHFTEEQLEGFAYIAREAGKIAWSHLVHTVGTRFPGSFTAAMRKASCAC